MLHWYKHKMVLFVVIVYSSGSQPGVRVPLGVSEELTGGTPNYFNESKKAILMSPISKKSYFYENVKNII
jgi:hypothetical protein